MTDEMVKLSTDEKFQECSVANYIKLKVTEIGPTHLSSGE